MLGSQIILAPLTLTALVHWPLKACLDWSIKHKPQEAIFKMLKNAWILRYEGVLWEVESFVNQDYLVRRLDYI